MKTAISIPDETFERATRQASARGMSRSEFVTRAVEAYLDRLDAESLTAAIDEGVALLEDDESTRIAAAAGRKRLARGAESW